MDKKYESIYIASDSHGNLTKISQWNNSTENSILLHAGDVGLNNSGFESLSRRLKKRNNYLIAIAGNHEAKELFDNRVYNDSLELIKDYEVRNINGENFLFIGGAISLDREYRKLVKKERPNVENWYRENEAVYYDPKVEEMRDISVLITHTAPRKFVPNLDPFFLKRFTERDSKLIEDLNKENEVMEKIYNTVKVNNELRKYFFAHYHQYIYTEDRGTIIKCLDIDQIILH